MNHLIIVILLSMVSVFLANFLILQTPIINDNDNYGEGYNIVEIKSSDEATEDEKDAMDDADDDDD